MTHVAEVPYGKCRINLKQVNFCELKKYGEFLDIYL